MRIILFKLVVILLIPVSAWATQINEPVFTGDIGRGYISAEELGATCVSGKEVTTEVAVQTTYRLSVRPSRTIGGEIDPTRAEVVAEMVISNGLLQLTEVKVLAMDDFEYKCGTEYLAGVLLGASVGKSFHIKTDEASKIVPLEIIATSEEDAARFQSAVDAELEKIASIRGWGMFAHGFHNAPDFKDFGTPLKDLFSKFQGYWQNNEFKRVGVGGYTKAYPK